MKNLFLLKILKTKKSLLAILKKICNTKILGKMDIATRILKIRKHAINMYLYLCKNNIFSFCNKIIFPFAQEEHTFT